MEEKQAKVDSFDGLKPEERIRVSYSLLQSFRNCRKHCKFRYLDGLKPLETSKALRYGSLIHACLERFHLSKQPAEVNKYLQDYYELNNKAQAKGAPSAHQREKDNSGQTEGLSLWDVDEYIISKNMMEAYMKRYEREAFEVVWVEKDFEGPIINLDSPHYDPIPGVVMVGKIDGLVKRDGEYWLLENKTASKIDGSYIDKLWSDFQIIMYCYYVKKCFNIDCKGVIYNVILKCPYKRKPQESEEDFQVRHAAACAKNKTGTSRIKRNEGEDDIEFNSRVAAFYAENDSFVREDIYISRPNQKRVISEISELTKAFVNCVKRERFYMNTDHCFRWGRPCEYFSICRSGENPNIINNMYTKSNRVNLYTLDAEDVI